MAAESHTSVSYTHLIEHCIVDAVEHGDKDAIKELERAIDRFMK